MVSVNISGKKKRVIWKTAHPKVFPVLMHPNTCPVRVSDVIRGEAYEIPIGLAVWFKFHLSSGAPLPPFPLKCARGPVTQMELEPAVF